MILNEQNIGVAFVVEPVQVMANPNAGDFPDIGTYVNPFTDFGFKRIFGQEMSSDILIDFLNELLADRESPILSITYLNNERQPEQKSQRRASFDLHCRTSSGSRIIIEMQAGYQRHIVERSLYYAALLIGDQAPRGEWDFSIDKVYSISILDFNIPKSSFGTGEVRHEAMLVNRDSGRLMSDKLVLIYLEMSNFNKTEDELVTRMDKWLYLLRNLGQLTSRPKALQDRIFKKIFTLAKVSEMDTKEYAEYRQSMKDYWDYTSSMRSNYELGVEKGMEQGRYTERTDLAKRLHQKGMHVAEIADLMGLPEEEIKDLLN